MRPRRPRGPSYDPTSATGSRGGRRARPGRVGATRPRGDRPRAGRPRRGRTPAPGWRWPCARRGARAGTGRRSPGSPISEVDLAAVVQPEPERRDLGQALRIDVGEAPRHGRHERAQARRSGSRAVAWGPDRTRRARRRPRGAGAARRAATRGGPSRRGRGDPRAAAPGLDGGLAGRASRDTSPAPARRWAAPAATGREAGTRDRLRASGSVARPPERSTRTAHSTISPPAASTAGIMASSEPPVVRMSSTSRTRSPGRISKPRRNSRRGPSSDATSSAKIARVPSWRPVSNARITPAGRGPGDEVDRRGLVLVAVRGGEERAQLARRRGILEHLELLQVGVRVAAALEHEVALAQGAAGAEQGLGPGRDRAAGGRLEGLAQGGHGRAILAAAGRSPAAEAQLQSVTLGSMPRGQRSNVPPVRT